MSRGLTDEPIQPEPEDNEISEIQNVINELIKGQNKLHDRIIDLERKLDHMQEAPKPRPWKRGL